MAPDLLHVRFHDRDALHPRLVAPKGPPEVQLLPHARLLLHRGREPLHDEPLLRLEGLRKVAVRVQRGLHLQGR